MESPQGLSGKLPPKHVADLTPDELVPAPPEHCGPGALLSVLLQAGGHLRLQEDDHLVQAEDD